MGYKKLRYIQISLVISLILLSSQNYSIGEDNSNNINSTFLDNLTTIEPIVFNSNIEMDLYAQNNNLAGDGTKYSPYIVDSVLIDASSSDYAIYLDKTDRYITVKSSYFLGGLLNSVKIKYSTNLHLFNNTIDRTQISTRFVCCGNEGIALVSSANITIEQNLIWDTRVGIQTQTDASTYLSHFGNYRIYNNTIHNVNNGIVIADLANDMSRYRPNIIINNFISEANVNGIYLQTRAQANILFGNKILNSYMIIYSSNNNISYNHISGYAVGIMLGHNAFDNIIANNTVSGSYFSTILLDYELISNNDFSFNNFISESKVVDYRLTSYDNTFDKNFYSDHDLTDTDGDGFTDGNYIISDGNIMDVYPLSSENLDSFDALNLSFPSIYNGDSTPIPTTSSVTPTTSTTTSTTTTTPLETVTITETHTVNTTNLETMIISVISSLENNNGSTNPPSLAGNTYQIYFISLTLIAIMIVTKRIKRTANRF